MLPTLGEDVRERKGKGLKIKTYTEISLSNVGTMSLHYQQRGSRDDNIIGMMHIHLPLIKR